VLHDFGDKAETFAVAGHCSATQDITYIGDGRVIRFCGISSRCIEFACCDTVDCLAVLAGTIASYVYGACVLNVDSHDDYLPFLF
jgi:hypothetical protein